MGQQLTVISSVERPVKISSLSETQIFISQSASCHVTAVAFTYEMLKLRAMDLTFLGSVPVSYSDGYWRPCGMTC